MTERKGRSGSSKRKKVDIGKALGASASFRLSTTGYGPLGVAAMLNEVKLRKTRELYRAQAAAIQRLDQFVKDLIPEDPGHRPWLTFNKPKSDRGKLHYASTSYRDNEFSIKSTADVLLSTNNFGEYTQLR